MYVSNTKEENTKSLPIRFPTQQEPKLDSVIFKLEDPSKLTCNCKFPFKYRYKSMTGCIKTTVNQKNVHLCVDDCCETLKLTSSLDINNIMWKELPSLKGRPITGKYSRNIGKEESYYLHESGTFYLCINDHGNWQVRYT